MQAFLGAVELVLADEKTVSGVTGAPLGFAGPVNMKKKIKIIADFSVLNIVNAVAGANKKDYHLKNVPRRPRLS